MMQARRIFTVFGLLISTISLPFGINQAIKMTPPQPFNYLALGDSYTIGESVLPSERWCNQLAKMLREKGINIAEPDIIARTGWTTSELAEAIEKSHTTTKYSLVSVLIGVNNQYRGESIDKFRKELRALLVTATGFAQKKDHVLVLSIPDWGVTPFAASSNRKKIADEIDAFNQVIAEECSLEKIKFTDVTASSRIALSDPSMVASDGLHFSGKMYAAWAALVLPEAQKRLRE